MIHKVDYRYGQYIIRLWYENDIPVSWGRVPEYYSTPPEWLSSAMDAYIAGQGFADMELMEYLATLFGPLL